MVKSLHSYSCILPNYFDNLGSTAVDNIGHKVVVVAVARVDLVEAESQAEAAEVVVVVEDENLAFLAFDFVQLVAAAALAVLEAVVGVVENQEVAGRDFGILKGQTSSSAKLRRPERPYKPLALRLAYCSSRR